VREAEIFEKGDTRKAATLASTQFRGDDDITFKRSGGKVTVTDPQGFTANVGKPIVLDDNKTVLPIDKVLMGSEYRLLLHSLETPAYCDVCQGHASLHAKLWWLRSGSACCSHDALPAAARKS
jgi:hypothetical protein